MIIKKFNIKESNLIYFVGINQFKLNSNYVLEIFEKVKEKDILDRYFKIIHFREPPRDFMGA